MHNMNRRTARDGFFRRQARGQVTVGDVIDADGTEARVVSVGGKGEGGRQADGADFRKTDPRNTPSVWCIDNKGEAVLAHWLPSGGWHVDFR